MAVSKAPKQRTLRRYFPPSEKRRIVELTLCEGASVRAIAREQGVNRNSLYQWRALYRAGKLGGSPTRRRGVAAPSAAFLPVTISSEAHTLGPAPGAPLRGSSVVLLMLASGAMLRIETGALDAEFLRALVAELQR